MGPGATYVTMADERKSAESKRLTANERRLSGDELRKFQSADARYAYTFDANFKIDALLNNNYNLYGTEYNRLVKERLAQRDGSSDDESSDDEPPRRFAPYAA